MQNRPCLKKTRELHNHHMDSTVWNDFRFRDDDIAIATYGKSETTWPQQIVSQLIFNGAEGPKVLRTPRYRPGWTCGCLGRRSRCRRSQPRPIGWDTILDHCAFDYMKANAAKPVPMAGILWHGGADTFRNKGVNGRWHDVLPEQDRKRYEAPTVENLGPECSAWLASGGC